MLETDSSHFNSNFNNRSLSYMIKERVLLHLSSFKHTILSYEKTTSITKLIQFLLLIALLFKYNLLFYLKNNLSESAINVLYLIYIYIDHKIGTNTNILIKLTPNHHLLSHPLTTCFINNTLCIAIDIVQNIKALTTDHKDVANNSYTIFYTCCNRNTNIVLFREGTQYKVLSSDMCQCSVILAISNHLVPNMSCYIRHLHYYYNSYAITHTIELQVHSYTHHLYFIFVHNPTEEEAISMYLMLYQERTMYVVVALVSGWNFVDKEIIITIGNSSRESYGQDKLVFIAISILLIGYLVVKLSYYCEHNKKEAEINNIIHLIKHTKTEILLQSNTFSTVFSIWQTISKYQENSESNILNTNNNSNNDNNNNDNNNDDEHEHQQNKYKEIQQLTKTDLINNLLQHIRESITSERDIPNRILYLKLKLLEHSKLINIIEGVESLMSMANRNNISIREQFTLVEFQQHLQIELFETENNNNSNIEGGIVGRMRENTGLIIEKALAREEFYTRAAECFRVVIKFWEFFRHSYKSKQEITAFFESILEAETELESRFKKLTVYGDIEREMKLMLSIEHVLNGHSMISEYSMKSSSGLRYAGSSSLSMENDVDNSFLIIEEKRIIRCSFEFLNEMGYSQEELINADKSVVFGDRFITYFEHELRNINYHQKTQFIIPIFNKQKHIVIKECSLLIYPEIKAKIKYLITFNHIPTVTDSSIIIYNPLADSVEFLTQKFLTSFQFDPIKIANKTSHSNLLSNELFSKIDLSSPESKELLMEFKPINCELILKHFSSIPMQKMPINITLVSSFSTNDETFYILSLKKGIFLKTEVTLTEKESTRKEIEESNENLNQVEKYRNEKFFCPIDNNYSIKITEKLSQISGNNKKNYVFYMKILFFSALLLLSGQITYSYVQTEQRIIDLNDDEYIIYNRNNGYIQISYLYSLLFKAEYFRNYPQALTFISGSNNLSEVLEFYITEMETTVANFLNNHLDSLRHTHHDTLIQYQLKFDSFEIETDTSKSTFFDFSERFSQYIKTYKREFLFENYLSFRDVAEKFSNIDLSTEKIAETFESSLFTAYIAVIVSIPLAIIGLFISIKIELSINQMDKLLNLLEDQDSEEVLDKINHSKGKLKEVESIFKKKQLENRSSKFSTSRIIEISDKISNEKADNLFTDNINAKEYSEKDSEASEENEPLSTANKNISETPLYQSKKNMESDPILIIILRNIYCVIFLGCIGIIIYLQISFRNNQFEIYQSLLKYQKELFQSQGAVIEIENDFYFKAEYSEFFNPINFTFYESHNYENLHSYTNLKEQTEFQGFIEQEYSLLFSDECKKETEYFIKFEGLNCTTVADGILENGYSQAFSIYSKIATEMKNVTLNEFLTHPCENNKCPSFIEEFYLNIRLESLISDHITKFRQFFITVGEEQSRENKNTLAIEFCLLISLAISFGVWIHFLGKRCRRSIKMFQIIPPYIMKKMKMTTFIRKNDILSCLAIL